MTYKSRIKTLLVSKNGKFDEDSFEVSIENYLGTGEFVTVRQDGHHIDIDPDEWTMLKETIQCMINDCKP